jgi:peroxiredoxin
MNEIFPPTVWIGPDGKALKHWAKIVKADEHPARVLEVLQSTA